MRKKPGRRRKQSNRKVILLLILCFPYGLFLMWRTARWHPAVKCVVTACFVALTTAVLLPQTLPPENAAGGVRLVGAERDVAVYGPELPEALDRTYIGTGVIGSSSGPVFSDVEQVEETYVYANDNGEYYHLSDCKYVAYYSKKYTLAVAHYSGYLPCAECGAPSYTPGAQ